MTKYIFHGGGVQKESKNNNLFYAELVKDVPNNGTVLLIYFASRTDDNSDRITYDIEKCKEFSNKKNFTIEVAIIDTFRDQVTKADAIYFSGGSTEKLISTLRQFAGLKQAFENSVKTVAGSSAGAYALSTWYSSHYEDVVESGLGIVPVRVVTHYESEKMPPRADAVENLKEVHKELSLIILQEGDWVTVNQ